MLALDLGIDLGTTTSRVYEPRRGVVLEQPATAADPEAAVRSLLRSVQRTPLPRPRVVLTVPCHTAPAERRALEDATVRAGARSATTIEAPVAAGIGAGAEVGDDLPTLVVDVGGRWTEVAVVAMGAMQRSTSVLVGGRDLDRAIVRRFAGAHALHISEQTAEELKLALGSAVPLAHEGLAEVTGADRDGREHTVVVSSRDVRRWIREPVETMLASVRDVVRSLPARTAADLLDGELVLTGGGAGLPGLDQRMAVVSGMHVRVPRQSHLAAVVGAGSCGRVVRSVGAEGLEPPTSSV